MKERNYARRYKEEFNWWRYLLQIIFVNFITVPYLTLCYHLKTSGKENIPKGRKFIFAANHLSLYDAWLMATAVRKPLAYMAKKELFEDPRTCWLMDILGAFAVNREKMEVSTLKTVREVFKSFYHLAIFPQGRIQKTHKIEKINKGFAYIAKRTQTDIIPVSITGMEELHFVPFKGHAEVKVGKPISHELEIDEIIDTWGRQVAEMCGYEYVKEIPQEESQPVEV